MQRTSTHPAWLVFASLLLLPVSLSAKVRHTPAAASRSTPGAHQRAPLRSSHHEPAPRARRSATPHADTGRQIPQPVRRPSRRSRSETAAPPRTLSRIGAPARRRSSSRRASIVPVGVSRRLRRLAPADRLSAGRNTTSRSLEAHTPTRFGPVQATPDDFLAASTPSPSAGANLVPDPRPDPRQDPRPDPRPTVAPRHLAARLSAPSNPAAQEAVEAAASRTTPIDKPELQSISRAAATPLILPTLYNARGRLIVPAPLLGSHEILVHQNEMADRDGLVRVQDDDSLEVMRERRMLLPIPVSEALRVDDRLPANRRYSRPWTTQFLANLSRDHFARFHTPLQVNSAVRTVEFQQRLLRTNGNAAPAEGVSASPHLSGQAVDLAKHGLSLAEIAWLRGYLRPLIEAGDVDVEEEFQQSCFHISVYKSYAPAPPARYFAASRNGTSTLATAIR